MLVSAHKIDVLSALTFSEAAWAAASCLIWGGSCTDALNVHAGHKFWYAKAMTTSEAFIFKCYDLRKGVARFGPHTAFKDPTTSPDASPRQSIEIRAYLRICQSRRTLK